jgi:hypothetical protein
MDIPCPICGEPWDTDEFHFAAEEQNTTYKELSHEFQRKGCEVLGGGAYCEPVTNNRTAAAAAMYELMGDDLDGVASMLEDAEIMGLI